MARGASSESGAKICLNPTFYFSLKIAWFARRVTRGARRIQNDRRFIRLFCQEGSEKQGQEEKGVLSLDDIGQQLERKARIQEQGDFEEELQINRESSERESRVKSTQNNEDSEWLESSEKPSLGEFTFRDFTEQQDEEIEEEKKNANTEANKTWNLEKKEVVEDETIFKPVQNCPSGLEQRGDVPSIGMADKIEEKIKAEEKKKTPSTAVKPEDQFETKGAPARYESPRVPRQTEDGYAPRPDRYEPPRPSGRYEASRSTCNQQDGSKFGSGMAGRRTNEPPVNEVQASESVSSWRTATTTRPASQRNENSYERASPYGSNTPGQQPASAGSAADKSSAFESSNWRSERPARTAQATPQNQPTSQTSVPAEPKKGAYVPHQ
uniref:Uncharacterized protein n=1 Tax=Ditylenchus dipsaci TaxID=166011 RepID=A0A915EJN8_9BILA